jgi:hypothetical protein
MVCNNEETIENPIEKLASTCTAMQGLLFSISACGPKSVFKLTSPKNAVPFWHLTTLD